MSKTTELEFQKGRLSMLEKEIQTIDDNIELLESKLKNTVIDLQATKQKIKELSNAY